jgi:hypothetical protein
LCYEFQTNVNQLAFCAPQVICSLVDLSIRERSQCSSNVSVGIVNSCCSRPIYTALSLFDRLMATQSFDSFIFLKEENEVSHSDYSFSKFAAEDILRDIKEKFLLEIIEIK